MLHRSPALSLVLAAAMALASAPTSLAANPTASTRAVEAAKGPRGEVLWNGRKHAFDKLPDAMPLAAREAIERWAPFSAAGSHQMALSKDGRVLLVVRKGARPDSRLALVEKTIAHVDRVLPLPTARASDEVVAPPPDREPAEDENELQLDGPGDDVPHGDGYATRTWSNDGAPLESETAVVLELGTRTELAELVRELAKEHEYLSGFDAGRLAGMSLERPLVAVWLASDPDNKEWNPDNELVHRTATLLLLRRFGRQPFWLQTGFAWSAEWALLGTLYCFPFRSEFVYAVEHSAWPSELSRHFERTPRKDFDIADVAAWQRGAFEFDRALMSFGTATWLAHERPGALSEILEDLRLYRDEHNKIPTGETSWRRDPLWEVPADAQRAIFEQRLGAGIFAELTLAFRRAKSAAWARAKAR